MTKESERDISRALAAFGAPRLKYHSFSRAAIAQPDPEPEPPAPRIETPIPPAPLPFQPLQQNVMSQPHVVPVVPSAPLMSDPLDPISDFQPSLHTVPMMNEPIMNEPVGPLPPAYVPPPAPMGFALPITPQPAASPRADDTAMTDIFSFLSMKPTSRREG